MKKICTDKNDYGEENIHSVRIEETGKRLELQSFTAKQAMDLAANELRARLDSMNEFRASLKDQSATFIPRTEFEAKLPVVAEGLFYSIKQYVGF